MPEVHGSDPYAQEWGIEHAVQQHLKNNFPLALMRLIEAKGLDPVAVYKRANIDRKLFSKIRTNPDYIPSKKTALALALAMELSLEETEKLLKTAGYALSDALLSDVIVEFFIRGGTYDFDEINAALCTYNQPIF